MTNFGTNEIRELRRRSGAGMMDCKRTLEETNGDVEQAVEALRKRGITKAAERMGRPTTEGQIASYIHHNRKLGVLVEVNCETDFVARTDDFATLVSQIAEHIAGAAPTVVDITDVPAELVEAKRRELEEQLRSSDKPEHLIPKIIEGKIDAFYRDTVLLRQGWIREPKRTIADLINEISSKVGENLRVRRFTRFEMKAPVEGEGEGEP